MKIFTTNKLVINSLVAAFWILMWYFLSLFINQPLYLPAPVDTLTTATKLFTQKQFYFSLLITLSRVVIGFSASVFLGILLAYISSRFVVINTLLSPFVSIMKPIPIMSIIILLLVWLKGGLVPIMVCFLLCFPIIYTNTLEGIKNIDEKLLEMAHVFKVSKRNVFKKIILPSLKPHINSGVIICIGFSWKAVVTSEVLVAPKYSIGYNLYLTKLYLNTTELFAWTLVVVIISILLEKIFKKVLA